MSAPRPNDIQLIPVADLLEGQVVRAVRGDRQSYRPVSSALCATSDPLEVARVLTGHCATDRLYIADLDALLGGSAHVGELRRLLDALPALELWLDAGFADAAAATALLAELAPHAARIVPVFGSESLRSREALAGCFAATSPFRRRGVLSLDRRGGTRLDPAGCWEAPELWPERIIVMTLERVGTGAGPDLETLAAVRRQAPSVMLIGAGGIRSEADLAAAEAAGADAWLVASALHDLQLPARSRG
jgi:phosphoribosylformimino-5-aminoimidazole carboxamide ribotide isomerase